VWQAADTLWRAAGRAGEARDVHVKLEKAIPAAAGLGGGSADAAAALIGLNTVWELRRPRRELLRLAATLGADVPFFLQGGTALGTGRGDEVYPVDDVARIGVIGEARTRVAHRRALVNEDCGRVDAPARAGGQVGWPAGGALVNDLEAPVARAPSWHRRNGDARLHEGALGPR
jgi:4-diphosphocytidyl-2-C-methyl-D-erythritol kinase